MRIETVLELIQRGIEVRNSPQSAKNLNQPKLYRQGYLQALEDIQSLLTDEYQPLPDFEKRGKNG